MMTPAEDPQVNGQGPGRVSLSVSSGTGGAKSDRYQVFPDYSQLVPDRTTNVPSDPCSQSVQRIGLPISHIMSGLLRHVRLCPNSFDAPSRQLFCGPYLDTPHGFRKRPSGSFGAQSSASTLSDANYVFAENDDERQSRYQH